MSTMSQCVIVCEWGGVYLFRLQQVDLVHHHDNFLVPVGNCFLRGMPGIHNAHMAFIGMAHRCASTNTASVPGIVVLIQRTVCLPRSRTQPNRFGARSFV